MAMPEKVSIVIPVYNEEQNIPPVFDAIKNVLDGDTSIEWDVLFVDDGSRDRSLDSIKGLSSRDPRVTYLELSRNFGKEIALTAGLHHVDADAIVMMDADLQHPPELIRQFVAHWRVGAEVVVGVRQNNNSEGLVKRIGSHLFYFLMNAASGVKHVPRETDFRLIDKKVLTEFKRFTERDRMTRGLLNWLGFRRVLVPFDAPERGHGKASYGFVKLLHLAVSSFISQSLFPLKVAGYIGTMITFVSGALGMFIFAEKYLLNDPLHYHFSGVAMLAVLNLLLVGVTLACLGLVALYIGNIHNEVLNRPLYVIRDKNT